VHKKHIPKRTCVACREVLSKRTLIRIVRTANGVTIDSKGKMPGRGAYIHNKRSCWEIALKGSLGRALKSELSQDEREGLLEYMSSLPNDEVQDR
jgi:hypothetical protein